MIPKIIHYCWFGGNELPEKEKFCISSWKKYLSDYEFRLWNEKNFDLDMYPYVREAYNAKKYAFVSDVVRLWAIEKFGGIYMDTDVEVLRSYNDLLTLPAFTGYENTGRTLYPVTGTMASEAHGEWAREQLAYYEGKHFRKQDGSYDMTANTITIKSIMEQNGFVVDGKYSIYKNCLHVFPAEYLCPKQWEIGEIHITKNTYCIHHFSGSWAKPTKKQVVKNWICTHILGHKMTKLLVDLKHHIYRKLVK